MIRVVLDTNVLVSAAFKRVGAPGQVLDLVTDGVLTPCVSDEVMNEYLDVLQRPILLPHSARAQELLELMAKFAVHVAPVENVSLCADPDDNRFLECALAAGARYT
jgi:putative PIN family toxin of toxin-antitoxin system